MPVLTQAIIFRSSTSISSMTPWPRLPRATSTLLFRPALFGGRAAAKSFVSTSFGAHGKAAQKIPAREWNPNPRRRTPVRPLHTMSAPDEASPTPAPKPPPAAGSDSLTSDPGPDTEPVLPPLTAHEFREYNRLAVLMDRFVRFSPAFPVQMRYTSH